MSPSSPFALFAAVLVALITVWILSKVFKKQPDNVKYASIDGLRGYLGFFVFVHHSYIWYYFLKTGSWSEPESHLFFHLGKSSVSLFFMVTGFLFFSRLFEKRGQQMDWTSFFVSRLMRLSPVYLLAMFIQVFIIIVLLSHFKLVKPAGEVAHEISHWLTFTLFGISAINDVPDILMINCGVVWSLVYEWIFYFSLPIAALLFFRIRSSEYVILIVLVILFFIFKNNDIGYIHFIIFGSGILAAFVAKSEKFCVIAKSPFISLAIVGSVFCSVYFYHYTYEVVPIILYTVSFIFIACGNTLFGLLALNVSRLLGQMAFTIYMFHGIVIFTVFKFILRYDFVKQLSPLKYWMVVCGIAPLLLTFCFGLHYIVELPGIKYGKKLTENLHRLFKKLGLEKQVL